MSTDISCSKSELILLPIIVEFEGPGRLDLDSSNSKRLISVSKYLEDVTSSGTGGGGRFLVTGSLTYLGTYLGADLGVYSVLEGSWMDLKN